MRRGRPRLGMSRGIISRIYSREWECFMPLPRGVCTLADPFQTRDMCRD